MGVATTYGQSGRVGIKAVGGVGQFYLDASFPEHFEVGVAARVHLGAHRAIEPELDYIDSRVDYLPNEWKHAFLLNVVRRFGDPDRRVRPYWFVGVGDRFGGNAENVALLNRWYRRSRWAQRARFRCGRGFVDAFHARRRFQPRPNA